MNTSITTASQLIKLVDSHLKTAKRQRKIPLLAVIGPTASGKTAFGIALASHFNGEIVSSDSRQIYRGMMIGTAQPTAKEKAQARHYLVDFLEPDQPFNLAEYQRLATAKLQDIEKRGKLPLLVGGTGLYISSITENYLLPDSQPDQELRLKMNKLAEEQGKEAVHLLLEKLDPEAAKRIHHNNLRYVIRALEIACRKKKFSAVSTAGQSPDKSPEQSPFYPLFLEVRWPREILYQRIEKRIDQQMEQGLLKEVKNLLTKYDENLPSISSLGYRELGLYLQDKITLADALELFKKNTRNFAKRQLTWFRKFPQVYSIPGEALSEVINDLLTVRPAGTGKTARPKEK